MAVGAYFLLQFRIPEVLSRRVLSWLPYIPRPGDPLALLLTCRPKKSRRYVSISQHPLTYESYCIYKSRGGGIWFLDMPTSGSLDSKEVKLAWVDGHSKRSGYRVCPDKRVAESLKTIFNLDNYAPDYADSGICAENAIYQLCMTGSLEGVRYLHTILTETAVNQRYILSTIVYSGNLALLLGCPFIAETNWGFGNNFLFHLAVRLGHLEIAQYLARRLNMTRDRILDVESCMLDLSEQCQLPSVIGESRAVQYKNLAIVYVRPAHWSVVAAAMGGHLQMLKYLVSEFKLTSQDLRRDNAIIVAADNYCSVHLEVMRYLHHCGLTTADFKSNRFSMFRAIFCGDLTDRLEILQFIHYELKFEAADYEYCEDLLCRLDVPSLQFLHEVVGLDLNVFVGEPNCSEVMLELLSLGAKAMPTLQYLHQNMGLTGERLRYFVPGTGLTVSSPDMICIFRFLREQMDFTGEDFGSDCEMLNLDACSEDCYLELIAYLHEAFGISISTLVGEDCTMLISAIRDNQMKITEYLIRSDLTILATLLAHCDDNTDVVDIAKEVLRTCTWHGALSRSPSPLGHVARVTAPVPAPVDRRLYGVPCYLGSTPSLYISPEPTCGGA